MDWEKVGKISYQFTLIVIEWGFKFCAFVAGIFALSASGTFGNRVGVGFSSLSGGLRQLFSFPSKFKEISWAARQYYQMGASEFKEAYGMASFGQLMSSLNNFFTFCHQISVNLSQAPFISIIAALLVFLSFYLLGRVIRFARQKGQGSFLCRIEQRLGDQVFNRRARLKEKVREFTKRRAVEKGLGQSSPKLTS